MELAKLHVSPTIEAPAELAFLTLSESEIFNARQIESVQNYKAELTPKLKIANSTLYIILKATRLCNLRCSYCNAWREGPNQVMQFEILQQIIAQAMQLDGVKWLHIVWHGGETTLLSRKFFQRAIWLQEHYRIDARKVGHSIQTNGTLVDDEWARFFSAGGFSVGVSLDVDQSNHDRSRKFKNGEGSFEKVQAGIAALRRHSVPFGALAVVDEQIIKLGARSFLQRIAAMGINQVGILNALPDNLDSSSKNYIGWDTWVQFLRQVFDIWHREFIDAVDIREIKSLFNIVQGSRSRICIYQGECMGQYLTIEPDGRVSACDKYVGDETHCFGSLHTSSLAEILTQSSALADADARARNSLATFSKCSNFAYCRGGCPHDAQLNARHGRNEACCGLFDLIEDMKHVNNEEYINGTNYC